MGFTSTTRPTRFRRRDSGRWARNSPRRLHHALGPGEFLAHLPESRRRNLVGLVVDVNPIGEFEDHAQVVADLHGGPDLAPAHAHRADGPRIDEPMEIVEIVAI